MKSILLTGLLVIGFACKVYAEGDPPKGQELVRKCAVCPAVGKAKEIGPESRWQGLAAPPSHGLAITSVGLAAIPNHPRSDRKARSHSVWSSFPDTGRACGRPSSICNRTP